MRAAFRGTVDDEYDDEADAVAEARAALGGRWGPVVWEASLAAAAEAALVGAVVTVHDVAHGSTPLLAYVMTAPTWQRRGNATWLVRESISRLGDLGEREVHLAVTRGNPARSLYVRLGFQPVDEAVGDE